MNVQFEAIKASRGLLQTDYDDDEVSITLMIPNGEMSVTLSAKAVGDLVSSLQAWQGLRKQRRAAARAVRKATP